MKSRGIISYSLIGVGIALLAAFCFSLKAIFVKLAYRDTGIDTVPLLALRMLFSLPFFLIMSWRSSGQAHTSRLGARQWVMVAVLGLLGYYISSLLDFLGLRYISAGTERLILYIYPTLVLLINAFWLKERPRLIQWVAVFITYLGLLISLSDADVSSVHSATFVQGALLIFGCAITFALYIAGSGKIIPVLGPSRFTSYAMTFASLGVLLHYAIFNRTSLIDLPANAYGYSFAMAIISTVIPTYLVSEGIRRIGSENVAIVGSIGPVATILQAHWLLQESISVVQLVGTAIIIAGVILVSKSIKKPTAV